MQYEFVTKWILDGTTAQRVYETLSSRAYGEWWEGVTVQVLEEGDEQGLGELRESVFTTKLPYKLRFQSRWTKLERPSVIEMEAFGELEGTGRYDITQTGSRTEVVYTWKVRTTKAWMNVFAPLMKPLFVWNHDQVMHRGAVGLANRLQATLVQG